MDLPAEVLTLEGTLVKIEKTPDGKLTVAGHEVTLPDIAAANGVIHGIDGVITNVTDAAPAPAADAADNIPEVLTEYPDDIFSILLAAVGAADLAGALNSTGPFTVFAPTDEAFAKYLAEAGPDTSSLTPASKDETSSPLHFPRVSQLEPWVPHVFGKL